MPKVIKVTKTLKMKPIIETSKLPKFLMVNGLQPKQPWNSHIQKPWVEGEVVMVSENQKPSNFLRCSESYFRNRFVRVLRKDAQGKWTLEYVSSWDNFNLLIKKTTQQ